MNVTLKRLLAPALLAGALLAPAAAQAKGTYHPRSINARERREQQRIRQGERSGELTRSEAERLEAEQARIRVAEAYARRSGDGLSAEERARLKRELNRSSRDIYRQKHDAQENERREERYERRHGRR
jgi:hypothetical protein